MQNSRNLMVAERALQLAAETYRLTRLFPREEQFGLTSQMRRAVVSVGSNIAEGCGRGGDKEFVAFLHNAMGSASELQFQASLAKTLEFVTPPPSAPLEALINEVMRMPSRLIVAVKARIQRAKRAK